MPELPDPKDRLHPWKASFDTPSILRPSSSDYAELHVTTNFTFLTGASHPEELVEQAAALGHRAIAVTDANTLAGIVRAHVAAKQVGIPLAIGCRLCLMTDLQILVYPTSRDAYARLCRLLTTGKRRTNKGECDLLLHDLVEHNKGLLAIAIPPAVLDELFIETLTGLKRVFDDDRLSLASSCLYGYDDRGRLAQLAMLADHANVPLVATNDVHYHIPERRPLQDVITCIRHTCTLSEAGFKLFPHGERYLKSPEAMADLFAEYPQAIKRTVEIAERAIGEGTKARGHGGTKGKKDTGFSLDELRYQYPEETCPQNCTPMQHLIKLTWQGAAERYPNGLPPKIRRKIEHEFELIEELDYPRYFLTVHDIVQFARSRDILCQGRGAAANSAVCYCLGVTAVDPDRVDLLFERFISKERDEPPDIDIDFEHERREEVIQYLYNKYGRDRAALTAEVITYRGRSAVREVGKALGLSLDCVDRISKSLDWWDQGEVHDERMRELGLNPKDPTIQQLAHLANEIRGFPRHLSQHVGGFVLTKDPLCEIVPIENAAMEDRTVIEWDKDDIDAMGMLKVDCLGLGMLTCIRKCFELIEGRGHEGTEARRHEGEEEKQRELATVSSLPQSESDTSCPRALVPSCLSVKSNHGSHQIISRSDCLAEGNGTGEDDLSVHEENASVRAVRDDEPGQAGGGIDPLEYCGRVRATEHRRLPEIPSHRTRFVDGTDDAVRTNHEYEHGQQGSGDRRAAGSGGSNSTGIDSEHRESGGGRHEGTKTRGHEGEEKVGEARREEEKENQLAATSSSLPQSGSDTSCLRAPVPSCLSSDTSCLRASVPSCLSLHTIPPEDPTVYDMICEADTVGVFQIESRAQMSMLPRLRPRCYYDLVIEVAIVRPGPIQGDMVHPYLRRRNGEEPVTYPNPAVEKILGKTLGVPLFQEQAMSLAIVAAGFTPGEADRLRRAIAAWKRKKNVIFEFGEKLINGMLERGYPREFAERCFKQIQGFSEYGFPESHAASFALLVYVSSWLKKHHPAAFAAGLINSQPMGFYAPAQIVRDAKEHGVAVRPVDANHSEWNCTLEERHGGTEARKHEEKEREEGWTLRLGMRLIKGMREDEADAIDFAVKEHGPFENIDSLWHASGVRVSTLKRLASADTFQSMGLDRQAALWEVRQLRDDDLPLFTSCLRASVPSCLSSPYLPKIPEPQKVIHDYATVGLSLKNHPMSFMRDRLAELGVTPNIELKDEDRWPNGKWIAVAGLVLVRQRPGTASGVVFMTLEDETSVANLIVRPRIYLRYRRAARHAVAVIARGKVERQGKVVHVMVHHIEDAPPIPAQGEVEQRSRNFH